jgi:phasin family protein
MVQCSRKALKWCIARIIVHCNIPEPPEETMADETNVKADAAAPAEAAATVAAKASEAASTKAKPAKVLPASKAAPARKAKRATAKKTRRSTAKTRTARTAQPKAAAAAANERNSTMNFDTNRWFASFNALPTATPFQTLFADAGERGQDAVAKSQKAAGELAELTRDNVEALTEAGRIAAEGMRSIGQDLVASTRAGVEKAADSVRALAEAKSPTEFLQIQSELARASFDRMVGETSRLTESAVKLAGEAFQPLSNRASIASDKLNTLTA